MILRRIALRNFRRFASFETAFAPGFNVVVGNNEEGKSTLREAITLALFQDPKTTDKRVLAQRRWGAGEQFAVELELEEDGKRYVLSKDFQTKTSRLEEIDSRQVLSDARTVEGRLKEMIGLPSRAIFESTVRIAQRDVTRIQNGQEIADGLQGLLTGGGQDVLASSALGELDKALAALKTAARSNPGPLSVLPDEIAARERAIVQKKAAAREAEDAQRDLTAKEEELAMAQGALASKEQQQKDCAERLRLEDALRSAEKEVADLDGRLEQIRGLEGGIARAEDELGRYGAVLAVAREEVDEIAALEREATTTVPPAPTSEPGSIRAPLRIWLLVVGLALVAAGIALPNLILVAAGVGVVGWEVWRSRSGRGGEARRLAAEIVAREQREKAEQASRRLAELLGDLGCATAAELRERRQAGEDVQRELGKSRAKLEGLLRGETVGGIEERRRAASRTARDLKERLEEPRMRLAQVDQMGFHQLQKEVEGLTAQVSTLKGKIEDLRVTARVNRVSGDETHALEEDVQELRERLAVAEEHQQVLALARQVMEEARAATMVSAKDVLQDELGSLVHEITGGRYKEAAVDGKLGIQLLSPERAGPVEVALDGDLSTGTVEQVYLAARLAIAKLLAHGRRPPLILDDPFVTYDAGRTAAVLALCRRLSRESQILLFTCKEGYQQEADHVVRLPPLDSHT